MRGLPQGGQSELTDKYLLYLYIYTPHAGMMTKKSLFRNDVSSPSSLAQAEAQSQTLEKTFA